MRFPIGRVDRQVRGERARRAVMSEAARCTAVAGKKFESRKVKGNGRGKEGVTSDEEKAERET